MKKILSLLLVVAMVLSLAACSNTGSAPTEAPAPATEAPAADTPAEETPAEETPEEPADETVAPPTLDELAAMDHDEASEVIYDYVLGDFAEAYAAAKEETGDMRMALMALAEAKMLESAVFMPNTTEGGNFAMSRVVPRTNAATTLWGLDADRFHTLLVCNEIIKAADRTELLSMWEAAESADAYRAAAKEYLEGKGYTFKDSYTYYNSETQNIWDVLATSYTSDSRYIAGTYDGLLEYDAKGVQQPGLAETYDVSADGTVYTFHLRQGVKWVDQQGSELADVTADDWVAGLAHVADNNDALGYLMSADGGCGIKNYDAYINGEVTFDEVGVKAVDDYTLEYTLEAPFAPFVTMMGYGCFAPLNRAFYQAQGGTFGADGDDYTPGDYGKTPANIAYCGPYLITNFTEKNTVRYEANPTYWNADAVLIKNVTWNYNDGSDTTRSYNEVKSGVVDGAGVSDANLEAAKTDIPEGETESYYDLYCYVSEGTGTTYCGWMNVNRGTWANYDDPTKGVSPKNEEEQARTKIAMLNEHFRRAVLMGFDRGSYNAVSVGEELKLNSIRNSYVPGIFQFLGSEVTVDINGTATTFPAGTSFGQIEQAQLDADGVSIKVWDSATASGDGFDGWYNVENAKAELELAIAELAGQGVEISAEKPIYIDYCWATWSENNTKMSNVVKQSIEASLEGKVIINLVGFDDNTTMQSAYYRFSTGDEANFDLSTGSGWGPDYGDAQTYLDTIQAYGYMAKNIGLF